MPACAVAACLGALAWLLDHGDRLGLGPGELERVGRVYFALLVGAPLLLYRLAGCAAAPLLGRLALSLPEETVLYGVVQRSSPHSSQCTRYHMPLWHLPSLRRRRPR